MKPRVYLETTIPSYLTAWLSRDLVMAARQQLTKEWWDLRRSLYDLYISQFVLDEAAAGDADAARRRFLAIDHLPILDATEETTGLAAELMTRVRLPPKAAADSLRIAFAAVHGVDFLLRYLCG